MGASFLCAFTGIENPSLTNNSAAFLQGWVQVFKQDKTMVVKAASQAQRAVDFILGIQSFITQGCKTRINHFSTRLQSSAGGVKVPNSHFDRIEALPEMMKNLLPDTLDKLPFDCNYC